ncbi:hypothetical protein MMC19_000824 [Ptychographa xylographoides]|nr:hypothetical protein [Ptychographa xylographoides]
MAEPQPPTIQPGAEGLDEPENPTAAPASAEDRKAAAALSTLDAHDDDSATSKPSSNVDQKALGDAMSKLSVGGAGKAGAEKKGPEAGEEKEKKKVIKVDQADVTLLIEELELNKIKATELLRAHEGDAVKAMRAYITASA